MSSREKYEKEKKSKNNKKKREAIAGAAVALASLVGMIYKDISNKNKNG